MTATEYANSLKNKKNKDGRMFYVDNIRIYLTILVILHHLAICYGGSGDWGIHESDFRSIDLITVIIFTIFNIVNQSYINKISLYYTTSRP